MSVALLRADARAIPLADESVDLIVTSPPYFALRSYTDGGEHYGGQIGSEATPREFIDALIECTREWMRVLKPTGSIFVNLGDKYAQATERSRNGHGGNLDGGNPLRDGPNYSGRRDNNGVRLKSLLLLPERYRIAAVDELDLIARAVIVWSKPNGLPESVTDRVRRSHEDWVHLTKLPRYFSAVDEIREAYSARHSDRAARYGDHHGSGAAREYATGDRKDAGNASGILGMFTGLNPLGKLPGSVWEIASQPLTVPKELGVDHFAAFPMEWPRRIILGWSPSGICVECGEGRRPAANATLTADRGGRQTQRGSSAIGGGKVGQTLGRERFVTITGYACACPEPTAPTRPAVVLDPFGGTGTTAMVASALGRRGISVDMSADYCRLARWRTTDPKQLERAARPAKAKPPATVEQPRPRSEWTQDEWLAHFAEELA